MEKTAFLFPGQGSQSVGMGHALHQEYDVVREMFDMGEEITRIDLRRLCFKGPMDVLTQTVNLQPAVSVVNLACLAVIQKEGGHADVSAGHSLGEFSALAAAGAVSGADALQLVFKRGQLMHRESERHPGAMQAVIGMTIDAVDELVAQARTKGAGPVSVANHNTETQIVITGSPAAVKEVAGQVSLKGGRTIPLKVSGAWHSELIKGAEGEFEQFLEAVHFTPPQTKIIHNVTADTAPEPDEIRALMARQLCSPVRWYDSMCRLIEEDVSVFVEVGPGKVLAGLLNKILPKDRACRVYSVNDMKSLEKFLNETL